MRWSSAYPHPTLVDGLLKGLKKSHWKISERYFLQRESGYAGVEYMLRTLKEVDSTPVAPYGPNATFDLGITPRPRRARILRGGPAGLKPALLAQAQALGPGGDPSAGHHRCGSRPYDSKRSVMRSRAPATRR